MATVRARTGESRPGDGSHRVEADDHGAARIQRQLVADLPAAEQLAEEGSLALGQPDEDPAGPRARPA